MTNNIPGPNLGWGVLYELREDPLHFILYARMQTAEDLAAIRFTNNMLKSPAWGVSESRTQRSDCTLRPVEWMMVPTPAKGAIPMKVYDGNGLLQWVDDLTRLKSGRSKQQERDLYRMVLRQWAQKEKHLRDEPFMAAIYYLRSYAGLAALEKNYPDSKYTAKARRFLAESDT